MDKPLILSIVLNVQSELKDNFGVKIYNGH